MRQRDSSYFAAAAALCARGAGGGGDRRVGGTSAGKPRLVRDQRRDGPGDGSLAEWCAIPAADLVPISDNVPDMAAAAIGTSGIAAWMALTWRGRAGRRGTGGGARGQRDGGSGGVGRGPGAGAERVVAVCRSDSAAARAQECGAHDVSRAGPGRGAAELTARLVAAGGPVDVVVDPVFGEAAAAAALALGPWGRLVNLGGSAHDLADFSSAALRGRSLSIPGYTNNAISPEQRAGCADLGAGARHPRAGVGRPPGASAGRVQPGLDAGRCSRAAVVVAVS